MQLSEQTKQELLRTIDDDSLRAELAKRAKSTTLEYNATLENTVVAWKVHGYSTLWRLRTTYRGKDRHVSLTEYELVQFYKELGDFIARNPDLRRLT